MTTVANDLQITTAYKHYISLVPSPHPAFRRLHLSVLQVMESWAGPGNEANTISYQCVLLSAIIVEPSHAAFYHTGLWDGNDAS